MAHKRLISLFLAAICVSALGVAMAQAAGKDLARGHARRHKVFSFKTDSGTQTPIKHLVVIFQENVSFDHYFGTYPNAANPSGEPAFEAAPNTPVNGLSGRCSRQSQRSQPATA